VLHTGVEREADEGWPDTPSKRIYAVACAQHFAVYDYTLVTTGSQSHLTIRYWVGVMLHPSVWIDYYSGGQTVVRQAA
jgi:hypothetical protein